MSVTYRTAGAADIPALAEMGRRCFAETFGPYFPKEDLALHLGRKFGAAALPVEYGDPALRIRMAEIDGEIVAYVKLAPMGLPVDHEAGAMEIRQLYVLERWQGAGVAAALMAWAVEAARAEQATALYLCVWEEGHRAIAFYRRQGFVEIGKTPFLLGTQVYQDPVMRLAL